MKTLKISPWMARSRPPLVWNVERLAPTPASKLPSGPPQILEVRKTIALPGRSRESSDPSVLPIAA